MDVINLISIIIAKFKAELIQGSIILGRSLYFHYYVYAEEESWAREIHAFSMMLMAYQIL